MIIGANVVAAVVLPFFPQARSVEAAKSLAPIRSDSAADGRK
jgi:hypothetical protein